jgi:Uma2 family endonuclease
MGVKTLLTVDQFLELPQVRDDDFHRYELWQGELVEMAGTIPFHNWIRDELLVLMRIFLMHAKLGVVLVETGVRLDSNTLYRPDVVFWDTAHWSGVNLRQSGVGVIPQLVVEVQSPSESWRSLSRKAETYIRGGVPIVWVFLEDPFEVRIFEKGRPQRTLQRDDLLEAPSVLPGFSIVPSKLLPPES